LLTVSGILIGFLIFAFKVSLGCGLASLSRRETLSIALGYLTLSGLMGVIIGLIPDGALADMLNVGMVMHVVVALLLVSLGVITAREWNHCGHDVSRRTFWVLSFPCPACLAASFISCSFLSALIDMASWKIGLVFGIILFFAIMGLSEVFRRSYQTPSVMGNVMIFVGLFYILSMLIIPAYLGSKVASTTQEIPSVNAVYTYGFLLGMIFLGFIGKKMGVSI
jgi:predicted transporter